MKNSMVFLLQLVSLLGCAQIASQAPQQGLERTSWQLVRFQGGDGTILTPDGRASSTRSPSSRPSRTLSDPWP